MKLEERSRDLAEENLKKEITNCLNLLEVRIITFGDYTFGDIVNVFKIAYEFTFKTKTNTKYSALPDPKVN